MGISILIGYSEGHENESDYEHALWFCNTADWGFGPLFGATKDKTAEEVARGFLKYHFKKFGDPRGTPGGVLENRYVEYVESIGGFEE